MKPKLKNVKTETKATLAGLVAALDLFTARDLKERLRRAGLPIPKDKPEMVRRLADAYMVAGAVLTTTISVR